MSSLFWLFFFVLAPFSISDDKVDKNHLHQLCIPCTNFFNLAKELNKNPLVHSRVIGICSAVLVNPPVCGILVTIGSTYVNLTSAEVMCERILLCPMEGFFGFGHTSSDGLFKATV